MIYIYCVFTLGVFKKIYSLCSQDARGKIWMCDIDGLLTTTRKDGNLEGHKTYYAKNVEPMKDLAEVVKKVQPSVIGIFLSFTF